MCLLLLNATRLLEGGCVERVLYVNCVLARFDSRLVSFSIYIKWLELNCCCSKEVCWATYGQNNIIILKSCYYILPNGTYCRYISQPWHKYLLDEVGNGASVFALQLRSLGLETKSTKSIFSLTQIGREGLQGVPLGCERGISSPRAVLDCQLPLFLAHFHQNSTE